MRCTALTRSALSSLSTELSRLQILLLQRDGDPAKHAFEGVQQLRDHLDSIFSTSSSRSTSHSRDDVQCTPQLMRSCATIFRFTTTDMVLPVLEALDFCSHLVAEYNAAGSAYSHTNFNEMASLLRSTIALSALQQELRQVEVPSLLQDSSRWRNQPGDLASLVAPLYDRAMQLWCAPQTRPTTLSALTLIQANSHIYGKGFHFTPVSAEKGGLLPCKSKLQMEAKMQRCVGARKLLAALGDFELNRIDAGMALATMAEVGLYDAEACNRSCGVLFSHHTLLSSQQLCQVVYALGVLQHRHIHQKFFSSLIDPRKCNAEAVRQHILGLAMLQQPPPDREALMDGVFLHGLRAAHAGRQHQPERRRWQQRLVKEAINSNSYILPPQWYIDVGHALTCLGIYPVKYKLMAARQARRSIASLTTMERCKLLYCLGGVDEKGVAAELQESWKSKVQRTTAIVVEKLKEIDPPEGPYVMNALLFAGVTEHPRIPRIPQLSSDENPIEVLLRTWSTVPKEKVMELTEQIKPQHLGATAATSTLTKVVARVAVSCSGSKEEDHYRFDPLCSAVEAHSADMSVDDTLRTIAGLQQIGIAGPRQRNAILHLLANLWIRRYDMKPNQLQQCCHRLERLGHIPEAMEMIQFCASQ